MEQVRFAAPDGPTIVGELRRADDTARGTAVLCHPHPEHGGSKDHPLFWAIRNELAGRRGLTVLVFNFRGVMGSEGTFGAGVEEAHDARAAIDAVRERQEGPTLVVGWSFGANVALRVAVDDDRVAALALIGLPLATSGPSLPDLPGRDRLTALARPVLLVSGAADQFSPVPELRTLGRRIPDAEVVIVPDAGHFFDRREREIAERIGQFADRALER